MESRGTWIRSPQSRALLWAALVMSLVLGAGVLVLRDRSEDALDVRGTPLSDAQAAAQVIDAGRQIASGARLRQVTAGYTFMSCRNEDEPPYQATLYMDFALPHRNWRRYLAEVALAMTANGWTVSPAMAEHFGHKLTRDGVTAVFHRNLSDSGFAAMRLYGECRNTADHRDDDPAWREISL